MRLRREGRKFSVPHNLAVAALTVTPHDPRITTHDPRITTHGSPLTVHGLYGTVTRGISVFGSDTVTW